MQTFMPSADFAECARMLDNKRLNKQALEAWQIMMTNMRVDPEGNPREPKGWYNHPAVRVWRGHEHALLEYIEAMVTEWWSRGYKSTILDKARFTITHCKSDSREVPGWVLREDVQSSHRTALLCKNYEWYSQFGWPEDTGVAPESYEYIWEE